jgi:hypothetical protein
MHRFEWNLLYAYGQPNHKHRREALPRGVDTLMEHLAGSVIRKI